MSESVQRISHVSSVEIEHGYPRISHQELSWCVATKPRTVSQSIRLHSHFAMSPPTTMCPCAITLLVISEDCPNTGGRSSKGTSKHCPSLSDDILIAMDMTRHS